MTDHFHRVDANSNTACGIALRSGQRSFIDFDDDTDEACRMHVEAGYRSAQATPLVSRAGDPIGMLNTHWHEAEHRPTESQLRFLDLLARQAADLIEQRQSEQSLRDREEQLRLIVEGARDYAIFTIDPTGEIQTWLPGAENVFGWSKEEAEGQDFAMTFTPDDRAMGEAEKELETARRDGKAPDVRWHMCKNGQRVFIDGHTVALRGPTGAVDAFLKIGQDTTDKHRASELQATLVAELQHRVRNLLALVRSVIRRTRGSKTDVEDFVQHLEGRIDAMARTQSLLMRAPGRGVDLEEMIRDEMLAQSAQESQLKVGGPNVQLSPKAAEVLTLAIHELATNSVKYGALGVSEGKIRISWSAQQRDAVEWLLLSWDEGGIHGPNGTPEPGFGTELITKRVPYELKGRSEMIFTDRSLKATIEFPLERGPSILQTNAGRIAEDAL